MGARGLRGGGCIPASKTKGKRNMPSTGEGANNLQFTKERYDESTPSEDRNFRKMGEDIRLDLQGVRRRTGDGS